MKTPNTVTSAGRPKRPGIIGYGECPICSQRGHFTLLDPPDLNRMQQLLVIHNLPEDCRVMKSCYVALWEDVKEFLH